MNPLDRSRLIHTLATALLAGPWNIDFLREAVQHVNPHLAPKSSRLPGQLTERFPSKPLFHQLVRFLRAGSALDELLLDMPQTAFLPASHQMSPPPPPLQNLDLPPIPTEAALASLLGISPPRLQWLADITGRNRHHPPGPLRTYRHRWIPKPHGPPRLLEIPKAPLKAAQRILQAEILDRIPLHPAAHGFRRGRSILTNAAPHCGKPIVLRFDLADFFNSIRASHIHRIFRTLGYPLHVARLLTGLCTTSLPADVWEHRPGPKPGLAPQPDFSTRQKFISRHVPQGAPTSPTLANLTAFGLDRRLAGLSHHLAADYTRYADDITFSGGPILARSRQRLEILIAIIALDEGFALNHRKTRLMRSSVRQHVTGLTVNVHPNIRRAEFDQLKAILTNTLRHGPASQNRDHHPNFRAHLAGKIAYLASIHPARATKLQAIFQKINWDVSPADHP